MNSIFDQITSTPTEQDVDSTHDQTAEHEQESINVDSLTDSYTPKSLKEAVQELLKYGILESDRKPNLYQIAQTQKQKVDDILEPLDLHLKIDEVRGLAFLVVAEQFFLSDEDEWSHPLIRRQRLNLEQSLLVAILRQYYVVHEQEGGVGAGEARVALDDLLPQLQIYLGDSGSDAKNQKRIRNLLEKLRAHGIVSEVDAHDEVVIRPIITHVADPQTLQNLLHHFRKQVEIDKQENINSGNAD